MDHSQHSGHHHPEHVGHKHENHQHVASAKEQGSTSTHDKHAGHHTENFLRRFWVCLILTIPVLVLSHMVQQWFNFELRFPGDKYVLLVLGSTVYFYGGWPFLKGLAEEIKHNAIGMMTLVALAITVAFVYSVAVVFGLQGMDFFWELATLVVIMLLGHWLEMRSQMAASRALESLVKLLPSTVHVEKNGAFVDLPLNDLRNNDIILIKPGEKLPADGHVIEGVTYVNESMLTGESVPVKKENGLKVIAGSINGDGAIKVHVNGAGSESYLNKVISLVQSAQNTKSKTQNLADTVAKWLTIISIGIGITTFIYWFATADDLAFALERFVTVMVTSCPHALGVAIPLVVAISTTKAAISGLLIRNRTAFENARRITTIVFDKTGTLTKGSHEVKKVISLTEMFNENEILQYAAAAQQNSEHYIASGILKKLKERNLVLWNAGNFNYIQGIGVSATVNGKNVNVTGANYFKMNNRQQPKLPAQINTSSETVSYVLFDNEVVGMITLEDSLREQSAAAIIALKKMGIKTFLMTGDNERIAESVADKLQMDGYLANVLPHQKQEKVKEFQKGNEIVAMTGDGVNDAPSLAQADVGIAVGSGTDVAAETADIILVNSDPTDVVKLITFGRATYRKMLQNLFWAVGYNVIAIPIAAGILYPKYVLSPALGAILMSLSTIIVAINARTLRLE